MDLQIEDLVEIYFNELKDSKEFKRLLELKKEIDNKYAKDIISFKTKESIYEEAKEKSYLSSKIEADFMNAKANLYEKEEVKEYLELERKINQKINDDFNEIKESISNKFLKNNLLKI